MSNRPWPDLLEAAQPQKVAVLLATFWETLADFPDLIERDEHLLAAETTAVLRATVLKMMLALNGIERPADTRHLNTYLGASQRAALEKTLSAPAVSAESWIGQAVALVVIYRWYAPQLVEKHHVVYPHTAEATALVALRRLPGWPLAITTD